MFTSWRFEKVQMQPTDFMTQDFALRDELGLTLRVSNNVLHLPLKEKKSASWAFYCVWKIHMKYRCKKKKNWVGSA